MRARTRPRCTLAIVLALLAVGAVALPGCATAAQAEPRGETRFAGRPLADALLELAAQGMRVVFTSNVVRPEMRVVAEPRATTPRTLLEELLAPHGLTARDGPNGTLVVVPAEPPAAPVPPPAAAVAASAAPEPVATFEYELTVTPSRVSLLRSESVGALGLGRDEIAALPHLGDDFFRALTLLPGTAGNDVSAAFHVRGARRDETLILLDRQELFDAYHLADYDHALSVVAPGTLGGSDLLTGGYAARYGDRMSGVLDLRTQEAAGPTQMRLSIGVFAATAGGSGTFAGRRGSWLAELRRGSLDLVGRRLKTEDPRYWDAFAKVDYRPGSRHTLSGHGLHAEDGLDFAAVEDGLAKRFRTRYGSTQIWLDGSTLWTPDLLVETGGALAQLDRDRRGVEHDEDSQIAVRDLRASEIAEVRQSWSWRASGRHTLALGGQWRSYESDYDYLGQHHFENPLAAIRHDAGEEVTAFRGPFRQQHTGLFLLDHATLAHSLTVEAGVRYDEYTENRQRLVSPRLQLAWRPGERTMLRLAWGRFDQSQRTYEVQVEDGEARLNPVERSEHQVVGLERLLGPAAAPADLVLRLELYRRPVANPRARYEDLFEPINTFPEVEPARVRVAPERGLAQGVELFLRGKLGARSRWWLDYTFASTRDEVDGHWVPRAFDQTHAVNLDLDFALGEHWRLNTAWRYHSGWPTTAIAVAEVVDEEGETTIVPVLGPRNGERLPAYHRLDLRLSRSWRRPRALINLFFDVQNALDRGNVGGYDIQIDPDEPRMVVTEERWPGFLASAGFSLAF